MPLRQVELSEGDLSFLDELVHEGRFRDLDEAIGAGLRLLRTANGEAGKLDRLRELADAGFAELEAGLGLEFSSPEALRTRLAELGRQASHASETRDRS